jgi:hypothetical protein
MTSSEAERGPETAGVNVTLAAQLAPAIMVTGKVVPQVWVIKKSAVLVPLTPMLLTISGAVPVTFEMVTT